MHGHLNISSWNNKCLSRFVYNSRMQFKNNKLKKERLHALKCLGVDFSQEEAILEKINRNCADRDKNKNILIQKDILGK